MPDPEPTLPAHSDADASAWIARVRAFAWLLAGAGLAAIVLGVALRLGPVFAYPPLQHQLATLPAVTGVTLGPAHEQRASRCLVASCVRFSGSWTTDAALAQACVGMGQAFAAWADNGTLVVPPQPATAAGTCQASARRHHHPVSLNVRDLGTYRVITVTIQR